MKTIEVTRREYSLQSGAKPLTIVVKRAASGRNGYGFQIGFPKNLNLRTFNFDLPSSRYKQIDKRGILSSKRTADNLCLRLADEIFSLTDTLVQKPVKTVLQNKDLHQKQLMEIVDKYAAIFKGEESAEVDPETTETTMSGKEWLERVKRRREHSNSVVPYLGRASKWMIYQRELPKPILRAVSLPTSRIVYRTRVCPNTTVLTVRQCEVINSYTHMIDLSLADTIDNLGSMTQDEILKAADISSFLERMRKDVQQSIDIESLSNKAAAALHQDSASSVSYKAKDAPKPSPEPSSSEETSSFEVENVMISLRGVKNPCPDCRGTGMKWYPTLSTWREYPAKRQNVQDICNKCWGTGDATNIGQSFLDDEQEISTLQAENRYLKELLSRQQEEESN